MLGDRSFTTSHDDAVIQGEVASDLIHLGLIKRYKALPLLVLTCRTPSGLMCDDLIHDVMMHVFI